MYNRNSKWDRQELYEKVWQFPLRKLAAEYSISDVGLAKICHKLKIPLPGLGYWTKIACGHTIPRPLLPDAADLPPIFRSIPRSPTGRPSPLTPIASDIVIRSVFIKRRRYKAPHRCAIRVEGK